MKSSFEMTANPQHGAHDVPLQSKDSFPPLWFSIPSLVAGLVLLLLELGLIIAVVAVDPRDLRMPQEMALNEVQRGVGSSDVHNTH